MMRKSIRLMPVKVRKLPQRAMRQAPRSPRPVAESRIIEAVIYLWVGEWIPAWGYMSLAFLVAALGVVGLGWWVLKADRINRRSEAAQYEESAEH